MADLITVDQYEARTGRSLTAAETTQVEALIADASALVIDIVNDSDITDTWDTATAPASLVPVVVNMVRRGVDNPNGYSQQTAGPFSHSSPHTSGIFASRDEARAIRKAAGTSGVSALNLDSYLVGQPYVSWLDGAL